MTDILIIEDEVGLATLLRDYLLHEGYQVTMAHDGIKGAELSLQQRWSLILLDVMLPGKDGVTLCRDLRQSSAVPVIMLSARVEEVDRLIGLECGADDYVCKPYSPREVVARVKAQLRRSEFLSEVPRIVGLEIDESRLEVRCSAGQVMLSAVEFRILATLMARPGQIFSRDQLIDRVYDDQRVVNTRTMDSHINKLRRKLETLGAGEAIGAVYGAGYRYQPEKLIS